MQNHLVRTVAFTIIALLSTEFAFAQDVGILEIGSGYRCSGSTILNKKGKSVKLGSAKTKVQSKIENVLGNSPKAKSKRSSLKKIKSNLTKCSRGQLTSGNPNGPGSGGETPGDNSAVLGEYSGTLSRVSINDKNGGCEDNANPAWIFSVRVSSTPGEVYVSAGSPFQGAYRGGAIAGGFKFTRIDQNSKGSETNTLVGTALTDTSATITITEKHERLERGKGGPRDSELVFDCEATYTGVFARDKNAP